MRGQQGSSWRWGLNLNPAPPVLSCDSCIFALPKSCLPDSHISVSQMGGGSEDQKISVLVHAFPRVPWSLFALWSPAPPSHHLPKRENTSLKYFTGLLWGSNSEMEVKVALGKVLSTLQTILYSLHVTIHQSGSLCWSISLPHAGGEILGSPQGIGKAAWLRRMPSGLRNRRPWYETYFASNEQGKVTSSSVSKK